MHVSNTGVRQVRHLDSSLKELGRLIPLSLSIQLSLTPISTANMTLPSGSASITVGDFMELYVPSGSAGIFRVTSMEEDATGSGVSRIRMEHGLCTLSDRIIYGRWQPGGTGEPIRSVIETMLLFQSRWQLGDCDPTTEYTYVFENENILSILVQLLQPLGSDYAIIADQTTTPWTIHIRKLSETVKSEMRLSRNMTGMRLSIDTSDMATRLYPFGSGSGGDQITILSVNGGIPYIEADTVSTWGILESVHTETTVEDPATLLAVSRKVLDSICEPRVSLVVSGSDFSALTGESLDHLVLGDRCRVCLPERSISYSERIVGIQWADVCKDPYSVTLELRNRINNAEDVLTNLSRKSLVQEVYAKGNASETTLYFTENTDATHPAQMPFYLGDDAIHVNKVMVRLTYGAFRGQSGAGSNVTVREITSTTNTVTVKVDGNAVPSSVSSQREWDALPYMTRDSSGKVVRNTWHEIEITTDGMCQVTAQLGIRTLIRTLTGAQA